MKAFVSYVIQEKDGHEHHSEIISIKEPPYSYSNDPPANQVMDWAKEKQKTMENGQELILLNIFKL